VVSVSESYVLITPLFSPMKTRPSAAKSAAVGALSPPMATVSVNPGGTVAATAGSTVSADSPAAISDPATTNATDRNRERRRRTDMVIPPTGVTGTDQYIVLAMRLVTTKPPTG
jgi:hypothetical protein